MTIHLHHLRGCAPTPLAHYLKAIGILRLLAQQKDPEVRGFWKDEHFCLLTTLDEAALEAFFLHDYAPTPFVSPWNKGSGFYTANDKGLTPVEESTAQRLEPFRRGVHESRAQLAEITRADAAVRALKEQTKAKRGAKAARSKNDPEFKRELAAAEREFKRLKADLYVPFALVWRGPHRDWMDAAMVLSSTGEPSWPALLGTGGNDGRLDFTNTAMQRIGDLFDLASPNAAPRTAASALLKTALFGTPSAALLDAAVGQFMPGSAGGANGSTGPDAEARINPWDFVLMLEGAIAFRGQATRKLGAHDDMRAAIPFAIGTQAVGHATRGKEKDARGEQWMPIWARPTSWPEISTLLSEGRAQLGRGTARRPLDFARAVGRLGVARGLSGFVRYGYLERNGQSNLAVPLGRIDVAAVPRARLIDDIGAWLDRLEREAQDAPPRFAGAVGVLLDAVFDALTREAEPARWQSVLVAIDSVERIQVTGTGFKVGPCPLLSAGWLEAAGLVVPANERSSELQLALALGGAARGFTEDGRAIDSVRAHALPLDPRRSWAYAVGGDKRLLNDVRVVMRGRDPESDLIALVERRVIEASQRGQRDLPIVARRGTGARLADLERFLAGALDLERIVSLGRALTAVRWASVKLPGTRAAPDGSEPDEGWQALRLCGLPFEINGRTVAVEASALRRLVSGDAPAAVELAVRRLRASGFRPPIIAGTADPRTARRWAAALAFPISPAVAEAMAYRFEKPTSTENA